MKYFKDRKWKKIRDNVTFSWIDPTINIPLVYTMADVFARHFDNLESMHEYCQKYCFNVIYKNKLRKLTYIHPTNGLINYAMRGAYPSTYTAGYLVYDKILNTKTKLQN